MRDCQAWPLAWTDEGKNFVADKGYRPANVVDLVQWLGEHYPSQVSTDPIEKWTARHTSLKREQDPHAALKKYCDFMRQTEQFREALDEARSELDGYIQHLIDVQRGK